MCAQYEKRPLPRPVVPVSSCDDSFAQTPDSRYLSFLRTQPPDYGLPPSFEFGELGTDAARAPVSPALRGAQRMAAALPQVFAAGCRNGETGDKELVFFSYGFLGLQSLVSVSEEGCNIVCLAGSSSPHSKGHWVLGRREEVGAPLDLVRGE